MKTDKKRRKKPAVVGTHGVVDEPAAVAVNLARRKSDVSDPAGWVMRLARAWGELSGLRTLAQTAKLLRVSERRLIALVGAGLVPARVRKLGKKPFVFFHPPDLVDAGKRMDAASDKAALKFVTLETLLDQMIHDPRLQTL